MAVTFENVIGLAPHLASTHPDTQTAAWSLVLDTVGPNASDQRKTLMWAHVLTRLRQAQTGGALASATVGSVSVSFSKVPSEDELKTTVYGKMYIDATRRSVRRSGTIFG